LAQRDLAGHADEQPEAEKTRTKAATAVAVRSRPLLRRPGRTAATMASATMSRTGKRPAVTPPVRPTAARYRQLRNLPLGREHEHGEQDDEREAGRQSGQRRVADDELGRQLGGDAMASAPAKVSGG